MMASSASCMDVMIVTLVRGESKPMHLASAIVHYLYSSNRFCEEIVSVYFRMDNLCKFSDSGSWPDQDAVSECTTLIDTTTLKIESE
jgi:hypothetical protein